MPSGAVLRQLARSSPKACTDTLVQPAQAARRQTAQQTMIGELSSMSEDTLEAFRLTWCAYGQPKRRCRAAAAAAPPRSPPRARPCQRAVSCASLVGRPRHRRERPPRRCSRAVVAAVPPGPVDSVAPPACTRRRRAAAANMAPGCSGAGSAMCSRAHGRVHAADCRPESRAIRTRLQPKGVSVAIGRSAQQAWQARGTTATRLDRRAPEAARASRTQAANTPRPNAASHWCDRSA